jgi:hypothetical protein
MKVNVELLRPAIRDPNFIRRFWSKVKLAPVDPLSPWLIWTGARNSERFPVVSVALERGRASPNLRRASRGARFAPSERHALDTGSGFPSTAPFSRRTRIAAVSFTWSATSSGVWPSFVVALT